MISPDKLPEGWLPHKWTPEQDLVRPELITSPEELVVAGLVLVVGRTYTADRNYPSINSDKVLLIDDLVGYRVEDPTIHNEDPFGPSLDVLTIDAQGNEVNDPRGLIPNRSPLKTLRLRDFGLLPSPNANEWARKVSSALLSVSPAPEATSNDEGANYEPMDVPGGYINGDNSYATCLKGHYMSVLGETSIGRYQQGEDATEAEMDVALDLILSLNEES